MTILVTGGTGYIGSHTVVALVQAGFDVVIVDNLSNSSPKILPILARLTGKDIPFYQADVRDESVLAKIFDKHTITAVMHFAGLKAVGESVAKPIEYYENNVFGSLVLAQAMIKAGVRHLVFSSSATVYGEPSTMPITEDMPTGATTNPYGTSKYMTERILTDIHHANPELGVVLLRYFNPIGAHPSGLIGEHPNGIPNNLMPYISQVAVGKLEHLSVFGDDYDTPDGTGVRDYIHVVDLAQGHVQALKYMQAQETSSVQAINLGTGRGTSVLELVEAFVSSTHQKVPYRIVDRRAGDIATCYACCQKAKQLLGWQAEFDIRDMCQDAWRWQSSHPDGYDD